MEKEKAIRMSYQIAALSVPSDDVMSLLRPLPFDRVLDLLLVLRQSPKEVKSPLNFLRRAIQEGWTAETLPEKISRKEQNIETRFYVNRGMTEEAAQARSLKNQREGRM